MRCLGWYPMTVVAAGLIRSGESTVPLESAFPLSPPHCLLCPTLFVAPTSRLLAHPLACNVRRFDDLDRRNALATPRVVQLNVRVVQWIG